MNNIFGMRNRIRELYRRAGYGVGQTAPLEYQVRSWINYSRDYIAAAAKVKDDMRLWLPRMQLTGQAVECALKACLVAAEVTPPRHHDLVELSHLVTKHGYTLSERDAAWIVHVNNYFYEDLTTSTRYKARYPAENWEMLGGTVPRQEDCAALVRSLCDQARAKRPWPK